MPDLTVISWRDIPAQVVAGAGRGAAKAVLADRFQVAIDLAATRAGLTDTDAYLEQWRRSSRPCGEDLRAEVDAEVARLEAVYGDDALRALVEAGGVAS
jgi:hypothetical protein